MKENQIFFFCKPLTLVNDMNFDAAVFEKFNLYKKRKKIVIKNINIYNVIIEEIYRQIGSYIRRKDQAISMKSMLTMLIIYALSRCKI